MYRCISVDYGCISKKCLAVSSLRSISQPIVDDTVSSEIIALLMNKVSTFDHFIETTQAKISRVNHDLSRAQKQIERLETQCKQLSEENLELKQKNKTLDSFHKHSSDGIRTLESEVDAVRDANDERDKILSKFFVDIRFLLKHIFLQVPRKLICLTHRDDVSLLMRNDLSCGKLSVGDRSYELQSDLIDIDTSFRQRSAKAILNTQQVRFRLAQLGNRYKLYIELRARGGGHEITFLKPQTFSFAEVKLLESLYQTIDECLVRNAKQRNVLDNICSKMAAVALEEQVRNVMGENIIGVREWKALFGKYALNDTDMPDLPKNIMEIVSSPCPLDSSKDRRVSETHMLFICPKKVKELPLTLILWTILLGEKRYASSHRNAKFIGWVKNWMRGQSFAYASYSHQRWVLMPKMMLPDSVSMTFEEQLVFLSNYKSKKHDAASYQVLSALEMTTGIFLHYLRTGKRLYGNDDRIDGLLPHARTSDKTNAGLPVSIGAFDSKGLHVFDNNSPNGPLGLCIGRVF